MWRPILIIAMAIFLTVLLTKAYFLYRESSGLEKELLNTQAKIDNLNKENDDLKSQINYFFKKENAEKELKSKFNYRKPDEKMMIIVQ